jgi:hypothetical protein
MEQESNSQTIPADGTEISLSPFKQAKEKIKLALKDFKENNILLQNLSHAVHFKEFNLMR